MLTSLPRVDAPTPLRPLKALSREDRIINQATGILERRMFANGPHLLGLEAAKDYLHLMLAPEPSEVFAVVFLTSQHQVITCETLFRGTIDTTTVHPRVVIQRSLVHNAAAIIVAHQHPSGCSEPSASDQALTKRLRTALDCVDVTLLDHLIIGKGEPFSFAATALL
ncbi:DNA repair protein RadC [Pseudomonas aeruginosa]|uniref:RadC family protein n=1 Tax=Pseudomonas aeruginosa TaxID=287 RepID=UPI0009ADCEAE|nr:DNA repair protein RadC [Pseudomonas aeruginosa]KSQ25793.2 DNA repair protein RadC [Pseudomonas aeruginosa]MCO1686928.1 DNA repair protein RadC [Pseudomonas aeruginosa]MCO1780343.1 DNA repair protein RadC [Pseudomonas aeruginosa]MCO1790171.1 DNA repair protein RadC [Pseudomonas aeruginosa]MCO1799189.1 DNA repair protein RadC [Pseudomonas aeruginosa]